MKNNIRKVCTRVLGFALAFSLTISNGVVALAEGAELGAKDGYIITYHNSHEWSDWGSTIADCNNQYKDTTSKECVQVTVPDVMAQYIWNDGTPDDIRNWTYTINDIYNEDIWKECFSHYGSYKMPIKDVGVALKCVDDSVWIIYQEMAYVSYYGADSGAKAGVITKTNSGAWDMAQPPLTDTSGINARIFFISSTSTYKDKDTGELKNACTDPRNGKYLKGVGYYYYSRTLQDGGESWDFGGGDQYCDFQSKSFKVPGVDNTQWRGGDKLYRWFAGKNILEAYEKGARSVTNGVYYESPTYGCVRDVLKFKGCTRGIGGKREILYNSDGTVQFVDDAVGGYLLADGHHEYFERWKCGGHYSPIGYKVVYDGNSIATNIYGDPCSTIYYGSVDDTDCTYDVSSTVSNNGFSKPGYTFKYWNTKADNTGKIVNPGDTILNWTTTNNAVITLYAIWEPINYGVNVYDNKPSDSTSNIVQIK